MSRMEFRPAQRRSQVMLNITPLVDVLFLLIIFFTVAGTFKRAGQLELHLPESSTSTPAVTEPGVPEVDVVLLEGGALLLNGETIELALLKARLRAILEQEPQSSIMIKAESGVRHGQVVQLLDIVRDAGFPGVGLGTQLVQASADSS